MSTYLFANLADTTLALAVPYDATTMVVASGTGDLFPEPLTNQLLALRISSALNSAINEIVYCTGRTNDTMTISRAQEGTFARNWDVGDFAANMLTAYTMDNVQQTNSGTTGQRPVPRKIGQFYFDTTLGYPIYSKQITPSVIWVNSAGEVV